MNATKYLPEDDRGSTKISEAVMVDYLLLMFDLLIGVELDDALGIREGGKNGGNTRTRFNFAEVPVDGPSASPADARTHPGSHGLTQT